MEGRIGRVYENIAKILEEKIPQTKQFIIVGYEYYGILIKNLLTERYGITPKAIVDDEACKYNDKLLSLEKLPAVLSAEDAVILTYGNILDKLALEKKLNHSVDSVLVPPPPLQRNANVKIGRYTYGPLCYEPEARNSINSIGSFCSFAVGCRVVVNHPMD